MIGVSTLVFTKLSQRKALAESEPSARLFRLPEIAQHNSTTDSYWIYYGTSVYNITDCVPNHPGGEVIHEALGGNIKLYWNIFTTHKKQELFDMLEQYLVGKMIRVILSKAKRPRIKLTIHYLFTTNTWCLTSALTIVALDSDTLPLIHRSRVCFAFYNSLARRIFQSHDGSLIVPAIFELVLC